MSDFEYYATIGMFIAGFILLAYLFKKRKTLIRKARAKVLQMQERAKAYYVYESRPAVDLDEPLNFDETINHLADMYEQDLDPWGREASAKRDVR